MALPFLDTNVLLRHLANDHPDHSPRATEYLLAVERGDLKVRMADTVVFETVFTLERSYRYLKARIREGLLAILRLPGIVLSAKGLLERAFDLYVEHSLSFGDAYHAALMERWGLTEIVTFDRGFDRIQGITRTEP